MTFRSISSFIAVGLAVSGLTVSSASSASLPADQPILMSGSISTTMAEEVTVDAVLWPDQESLAKGKVGDKIKLLPVPVDLVGDTYLVRLDPASVPAKYISDGRIDVEVIVTSGDMGDSYSETAKLIAGAWAPAARSTGGVAGRAAAPTGLQHNFTLHDPNAVARGSAGPAVAVAAKPGGGGGCGRTQELVETYDKWVKVADVMPAKKKMKGRIIYSSGASHTIGTAIKAGGWSVGGSGTETIGETVVGGWLKGNKTAWTSWEYGEYKRPTRCNVTRVARPIRHQGGYITTKRSRPDYQHCRPYNKTTWTQARGAAWTYSAGVEVHGLSLDAQTGYSQEVQVQYDIKDNKRMLCGNNTAPAYAELIMGKRRA